VNNQITQPVIICGFYPYFKEKNYIFFVFSGKFDWDLQKGFKPPFFYKEICLRTLFFGSPHIDSEGNCIL